MPGVCVAALCSDIVAATSGFIDFIVAPSLEVCGELLDKIYSSESTRSQEPVAGHDDAKDGRYQSMTAIPDPASMHADWEKGQESSSSGSGDQTGSASRRYVSKLIPQLVYGLIFLLRRRRMLLSELLLSFFLRWIFFAPMAADQ